MEIPKNGIMKRTNAQYWACQIGGWGAVSAIGIWSGLLDSELRVVVIGYVLFFLYSIGLTHLLRREMKRRKWISLPLSQVLLRLAAASVAIGAVQSILVVGIYTAIEGRLGVWDHLNAISGLFMGVKLYTAIWAVLYLTITTQRRSHEARRNEQRMKAALGEAELRALEAQVNPHFLFNCLNSIRGMISEDPAQAQDMVTRLAHILRYSLRRERPHMVSLASEVEAVSDYLALEAVRFEDRLRVHLSVEETALQRPVPPMLLQMLVENAIKHGVEDLPSGGDLFIRAGLEGDALRIEVENDGRLSAPPADSTQIGLANARERLRILYGELASLQLAARGEERVAATILIPATP